MTADPLMVSIDDTFLGFVTSRLVRARPSEQNFADYIQEVTCYPSDRLLLRTCHSAMKFHLGEGSNFRGDTTCFQASKPIIKAGTPAAGRQISSASRTSFLLAP